MIYRYIIYCVLLAICLPVKTDAWSRLVCGKKCVAGAKQCKEKDYYQDCKRECGKYTTLGLIKQCEKVFVTSQVSNPFNVKRFANPFGVPEDSPSTDAIPSEQQKSKKSESEKEYQSTTSSAMTVADAFKIMGLEAQTATSKTLQSQYKEMALMNHPDRGGDEEDFKKINEANEVLKKYFEKQTERVSNPPPPEDALLPPGHPSLNTPLSIEGLENKEKFASVGGASPPPPPLPGQGKKLMSYREKQEIQKAQEEQKKKEDALQSSSKKIIPIHEFKKIGEKPGGSVPGAKYHLESNEKDYIIKYTTQEVAINEVLSAQFYKEAGIAVPNFVLVDPGMDLNIYDIPSDNLKYYTTKPYRFVAVEFINDLKPLTPQEQAERKDILDGFIIDAWLANYDVIGLEYDNILDKDGQSIRADVGASLEYKAQGGPKGGGFNKEVNEISFLENKCDSGCLKNLGFSYVHEQIMKNASEVFKNLKWNNIEHGINILKTFTDQKIRTIVQNYGPPDTNKQDLIVETLIQRRDTILTKWVPLLKQKMPVS